MTTNRLINEKSPYLLQHAHNPVDWFPWGEAAFAEAAKRDVPVLLSVGYSTCHWCHVMERESFAEAEIARVLNETFVCIKVDREERPDIDTVYMNVCQALTGSGGWPLTVIMTAEKTPFFAGTYFPPKGRYGRPGLLELTTALGKAWRERRQELLARAEEVMQAMQEDTRPTTDAGLVSENTLHEAYRLFSRTYDSKNGGFRGAPKFPSPHNLSFLLRYWQRTGEPEALQMVGTTLDKMRLGGIFDHLGGGFHRYSTDARWLVPHFEKMLYDQALLTLAYTEAWQVTGRAEFKNTAREILAYVLRDMQAGPGGFFAAEDADSEGMEGKFYVWTEAEIKEALAGPEARLALSIFNISSEGNYLQETTQEKDGSNILHLRAPLPQLAALHGLTEDQLQEQLASIKQKLFTRRELRIHPFKDRKILTDWNGLMIAALGIAGRAFQDMNYLRAARNSVSFIQKHLLDEKGRLYKRWCDGQAGIHGQIDDYAFFIWGLLELYAATMQTEYLRSALDLQQVMVADFWDEAEGGFYISPHGAEELPLRPKEIYDGAIPSGNAVAALNSLRLARLSGSMEYEEYAQGIFANFAGAIDRYPPGYAFSLMALDFDLGPTHEVVVVGQEQATDTEAMLQALQKSFLPRTSSLFYPTQGPGQKEVAALAPFVEGMTALDGQATAYVCKDFACDRPTKSPDQMLAKLK